MKADASSLSFLANEGVVRIPFFQRRYVWNEENWGDLYEDMLDQKKKQFLGSLILKQQGKQSGKNSEVLVIDGQQRLTTLSILLKALFDSFPTAIQENVEEVIHTHLFYKKSMMDKSRHVKIAHSRFDAQHFSEVIESKLTVERVNEIGPESSNVHRCYKFFTARLKEQSEEIRSDLFERLIHKENKFLVLIDLDEKEDEQAIFDTINSAGVRLSGADIVKNSIFQRAASLMDLEELDKLYVKCWENIFATDEDTIKFWDAPKRTGRLMRDNIEILLHAVAVIKGFFNPDEHTLSKLPTLYKERISLLDRAGLELFANEISDYAELYRKHMLSFDKTTLFSFGEGRQRLFHVLDVCEVSTFHPYILSLFYKYADDQILLDQKLLDLEKLVVRRLLAARETKSYNKLCLEFISDDSLPEKKAAEIQSEVWLKGAKSITNKHASLLLFWIELRRRFYDNKTGLKELKFNYSLEHVLPQKWEKHWSAVPVRDSNGLAIDDWSQAKSTRSELLYSLGNMTLLTGSLNSSLKNYSYNVKLNGEGKKKGIASYADLFITKHDIVDKFDGEKLIWDEVAIRARTKTLCDELVCIW